MKAAITELMSMKHISKLDWFVVGVVVGISATVLIQQLAR